MKHTPLKFVLLLALSIVLIPACHEDSNPAVPGAPENDVITTVERNPLIRVGLLSFTPQKNVYVSINRGSFDCFAGDGLMSIARGTSGDVFKITGGKTSLEFGGFANQESGELNNKVIRIQPSGGVENGQILIGPTELSLRPYRGIISLHLEGENVLAVNEVPLEDYLFGVVPAEMNPEWEAEALRAQAVVSRTYALYCINRYKSRGFDLTDDERSQKYGGLSVEIDTTTNAAIDTADEVVTFDGRLAITVFHRESGGTTASSLDIWPVSGEIPYLMGISDENEVTDFSTGGEYESWSNWADFGQLHTALNLDGETFTGDYLSSITILGLSESGRVRKIDILGQRNPVVDALIMAQVLNRRLGPDFLPSNQFTMKLEDGGYRFIGTGKGHGVGMSQWGAHKRASLGQDYKQIIQSYYPGCTVEPIPIAGIEILHNTRLDLIH